MPERGTVLPFGFAGERRLFLSISLLEMIVLCIAAGGISPILREKRWKMVVLIFMEIGVDIGVWVEYITL